MKTTRTNPLLTGIMALLLCSTARGQLIYSNNFAGGTNSINQTAPTFATNYAGGTNTALWICTFTNSVLASTNGTILANGSIATNAGSAILPFKPQSGAIYFLTASVTLTSTMPNWVGLGFCQGATTSTNPTAERFTDPNVKGGPWMSVRAGSTVNFFGGPETSLSSASQNVEPTSGTYTVTVVLNTFAANWWTAGYINGTQQGTNIVGGTQLGTNISYLTNPTINYVGFTQQGIPTTNGIEWNNVALTTAQLPIIITQPASGSAYVGGSYTNTVLAIADTNGGTLFYQWYTNGVAFTANTSNSALVIDPVTIADDSTNFTVVISNKYGMTTSSPVSLTVITTDVPPQLATNVQTPFSVLYGGTVSNTITVTGTAPLSYQWLYNGVDLTDNGQITGSLTSSLTISGAQAMNEGSYQVIVTNNYGALTSSVAVLSVVDAQPITFYSTGPGWTVNSMGAFSNGAPVVTNGQLVLTDGHTDEGRDFFFDYPQYIGAFKAAFTYRAFGSADGASFCLQNDPRGTAAEGGIGGGLGVGTGSGGSPITPSVELEFNIYPLNGLGGTGYCFQTNGVIGSVSAPGSVSLTNGYVDVSVTYSSGQLTLAFSNELSTATYNTTIATGDLTQVLGTNTAYVGFTGSDGGVDSTQIITNFSFISYPPANIQLSSGNALITWPGINGYALQENSNLSTTNWVTLTNLPSSVNGSNQLAVPITGSNVFYRLILQ
jgi:Immunoglobulin I-set domain